MEGLEKHLTEEPNTRENTAEEYLQSLHQMRHVKPLAYTEVETLEAIRLSKIEVLEEQVCVLNFERDKWHDRSPSFYVRDGITLSIQILNSKINELKNEK